MTAFLIGAAAIAAVFAFLGVIGDLFFPHFQHASEEDEA